MERSVRIGGVESGNSDIARNRWLLRRLRI